MSKLGSTLKNKRETLGYDVDKVTEETRISADIIDVLEKGEFKDMPSYNHAKNFVKNYAVFLKLDMDKVQQMFDEECTKNDFSKELEYIIAPVTKEAESSPASGMKFIISIIIVAVIAFGGYKVFTAMEKGETLKKAEAGKSEEVKRVIDEKVDTPVENQEVKEVIEGIVKEAAEPEEVAEAVEEPEKTEEISREEETDMAAFLPDEKEEPKAAAKTAIVNFADVCWVHIKIDDDEEMDFIAEKGNRREIVFHDNFVMDIGNAAVVSVSYNNRTIAGLGAYKQPVKGLKFTVNEKNRLKYTSVK